jgi:hypothetical protein
MPPAYTLWMLRVLPHMSCCYTFKEVVFGISYHSGVFYDYGKVLAMIVGRYTGYSSLG